MSKFKIGDKVECIEADDIVCAGSTGTIIEDDGDNVPYVAWDNSTKYGYYNHHMHDSRIKLIETRNKIERYKLTPDKINPSHYKQGDIECIDAIKSATKELNGFDGMCTGNAIKYLWRWKQKNGVEDLKKAKWYIDKLIGENEVIK